MQLKAEQNTKRKHRARAPEASKLCFESTLQHFRPTKPQLAPHKEATVFRPRSAISDTSEGLATCHPINKLTDRDNPDIVKFF